MSKTPTSPSGIRDFTRETKESDGGIGISDELLLGEETTPSSIAAIMADQGQLKISPDLNPTSSSIPIKDQQATHRDQDPYGGKHTGLGDEAARSTIACVTSRRRDPHPLVRNQAIVPLCMGL